MLGSLVASWQDALVTLVALLAAGVVVWRTIGNWRENTPGRSPHCDGCAMADDALHPRGSEPPR